MEDESETQTTDKSTNFKDSKAKDLDFVLNTSSEDDDEDTIQEQEVTEGKLDHKEEIEDLKGNIWFCGPIYTKPEAISIIILFIYDHFYFLAENNLSIEELKKKYSNLPPVSASDTSNYDSSSDSDGSESNVEGDKEDSSEDESDKSTDIDMDISESENHGSDVGLKSLLDDSSSVQNEGEIKTDNQDLIDDAAAIAESIQPKGNTLSSTSVSWFLIIFFYSWIV